MKKYKIITYIIKLSCFIVGGFLLSKVFTMPNSIAANVCLILGALSLYTSYAWGKQ
jgi:hypothetical protein